MSVKVISTRQRERVLEVLRDAKLTTYQMEQKMGADGNLNAMELYTKKYRVLEALLAELEAQ